jgi:hypothetical protein
MHPKLLLDVIKRQAGTVQKAILEGVMNSIEAGASKVEVTINLKTLVISDDGKGFRDETEIANFFETFGHPHDGSEGKVWAQFRMGRGQLFAFGRNVWRTGQFRMTVDVNSWASSKDVLGYSLEKGLSPYKGCEIDVELYETIGDREAYGILREIEKYVKYVPIPVIINGKQVNTPPENQKWPDSCEDALIRLTDGARGLDVYNLGVFVRTYHEYEFGTSGVVVSRKRLDVNFARNDVIKSCAVWRRIKEKVDKSDRVKQVREKKELTDGERLNLIDRLCAGEVGARDVRKSKILVDASGRPWSPEMVLKAKFPSWSMAPRNDDRADKLLQQGACLVLDEEIVRAFDRKPAELLSKELFSAGDNCTYKTTLLGGPGLPYVKFEDAAKGIRKGYAVLGSDKWKMQERLWVRVAQRMSGNMGEDWSGRDIVVGLSNVADAWTDGKTYVALGREWLEGLRLMRDGRPCLKSIMEVARVLLHELCHDGDSSAAAHSPEFYRAFHDRAHQISKAAHDIHSWLSYPAKYEGLKNSEERAQRGADKREDRQDKVAAIAKAEPPKPKTPPTQEAARGEGLTAADMDEAAIRSAWELREKERLSWSAIEKRLGLRRAKGMTAVRAHARWAKAMKGNE